MVQQDYAYILTNNQRQILSTNQVYQYLIKWKDMLASWGVFFDFGCSNPIYFVDYVQKRGMNDGYTDNDIHS